jgi:hypothetical protein
MGTRVLLFACQHKQWIENKRDTQEIQPFESYLDIEISYVVGVEEAEYDR